jgi:positive regulator of sigma E activity
MLRRKPALLQVHNAVDARLGQVVTVAIPEHVFLRLVLSLYLVPLLAGLAGAAAGQYFAGLMQVNTGTADGMSLFAAVFSFALALYLGRGGQLKLTRELNIRLLGPVREPSAASLCQSKRGDADG